MKLWWFTEAVNTYGTAWYRHCLTSIPLHISVSMISCFGRICPSVEIIYFPGNWISNRPLDLKFGLNVGSACPKGVVFRNFNCTFMQLIIFCKLICVNGFD